MSKNPKNIEDRRRFLKIVGSSAVLVPVLGIAGCSGGNDAAPEKAAAPAPAPAKPDVPPAKAAQTEAKSAAAAETPPKPAMPKLSEDDPQAKTLSYVHEAASVDSASQPRYKSGQVCANCALFQAKGDDEWGGCSIFPGKLVKASGWCSVYAPKAV